MPASTTSTQTEQVGNATEATTQIELKPETTTDEILLKETKADVAAAEPEQGRTLQSGLSFEETLARLASDYKEEKRLREELVETIAELRTEVENLTIQKSNMFTANEVQEILLLPELERAKQKNTGDPLETANTLWQRWKSNFGITCNNITRRKPSGDGVVNSLQAFNMLVLGTTKDSVRRVQNVYFNSGVESQ